MNAPPHWMKDPVTLGNWLATRVKFAKNTSERLNQVSRVDAVCWFLTLQVDFVAASKDIKLFAGAFAAQEDSPRNGCCSLLNSCYGGVGKNFSGEMGPRYFNPRNYGPVAPLYRPAKHFYSPTVNGVQRAARVSRLLNGSVASAAV